MFEYAKLSNSKMSYFKTLNNKRTEFNILNMDFFKNYYSFNFIEQFFMRKKVIMLKKDNTYIGYIWADCNRNGEFIINSFYSSVPDEKYYSILLKAFNEHSMMKYYCESNSFNSYILDKLGFKKIEGSIEMEYSFNQCVNEEKNDNIEYIHFKKGKDEKLRCFIQNEAFKNSSRIPLTEADIYFDELQKYYIKDAAIFMKVNDKFIGYGQVIIEKSIPLIVNVGILQGYRGNGYGRMLLLHLLHMVEDMSYKKVKIKVGYNNVIAMSLYRNLGFDVINEKLIWQKTYPA